MTTLSPIAEPVKAGQSLKGSNMTLKRIINKQEKLRLKKSELADSIENIKLQLEVAKLKEDRCNEELDLSWYISAKAALRHLRKDMRQVDMELSSLNTKKKEAFDNSFTEVARLHLEKETFDLIKDEVFSRISGGEDEREEEIHSCSKLSA